MENIERHARSAIIEWIVQQERFARSVLARDGARSSDNRASGILLCARTMRLGLTHYEEPAARRAEILSDLIGRWKNAHPGRMELPGNILAELGIRASRRAFEESYPDLARFADEITTMRKELEGASAPLNIFAGLAAQTT